MKLAQELIVAGVFLLGSWVALSVVASAFPPSSSSVRKALTSHVAPKRIEPTVVASNPEPTVPPVMTYLQDEKQPVVQVVSGDLAKNELYIFGENESVPEQVIENHPDATIAVLGGDETEISQKIEKFNIASKNVAIRVALAREAVLRQAEADNKKLQEWNEQKKNFAVEVKSKSFELPVPQVLNNTLKKMAVQPGVVLPDTGLDSPIDDNKQRADAGKPQKNKAAMSFTKAKDVDMSMTQWQNKQLQAALKLVAENKKDVLLCKQEVSFVAIKPQQHAANKKVESTLKHAAAKISKPLPTLKPLDENFALNLKPTVYQWNTSLALAADSVISQPVQNTTAPVTEHQARPAVIAEKSQPSVLHVIAKPAANKKLATRMLAASQIKLATATTVTKRFKQAPQKLVVLKAPSVPAPVIKAAVPKVKHVTRVASQAKPALSNVIVVNAKSPDADSTKSKTSSNTTAKHKVVNNAEKLSATQQAQALRRQKVAARERAMANLERQLAEESMISSPPPVAERRIEEASSERAVREPAKYQRYRAPAHYEQARRHRYQPRPTYKKQQSNDVDDFGDFTGVASHSSSRAENEVKEMTRRFHDPVEYSKLMQE